MFATLSEWLRTTSWLEILAVVTAVGYLLLAIRQIIWCWACAGVSTAAYVYLFADAGLYMESALNVFYFAMAAYGWWVWHSGCTAEHELPVVTWPHARHGLAIVTIGVLSGVSGFLLERYTEAQFPYVDSLTTWSAIWATFLLARKVFENWWYWLVIDVASIFIFTSRGLDMTALLFVIYVILIPFGLLAWRRSMHAQGHA